MRDANTQEIKIHLTKLARYYGYAIDPYQITAYASDLSDLDQRAVERALNHMREDHTRKRLPLPAEVRHFLSPKLSREAQAQDIVARIYANIQPIGQNRPKRAEEVLGPTAWEVVRRMGGWGFLCTSDERDRNTQYAQAREQAKALLERGEAERQAGQGRSLPELTTQRTAPTRVGDTVGQVMGSLTANAQMRKPPLPVPINKSRSALS